MTLCAACKELQPNFIGSLERPQLETGESCKECGKSSIEEKEEMLGQ